MLDSGSEGCKLVNDQVAQLLVASSNSLERPQPPRLPLEDDLPLRDFLQYRRAIERVAVVNQRHVAVQLNQFIAYSRHYLARALYGGSDAVYNAA